MSLSLNIIDKSRLFLSFADKKSTKALVGTSNIVFGDVKIESSIIESCSSSFFSSIGSNLNSDDLSTLLEIT